MSQQGAALQTYNNELVKHVEAMLRKREVLVAEIASEQKEKAQLVEEQRSIQEKIDAISARISDKMTVKTQYDRVLADAEAAYMKILESSQMLLSVLKKETVTLNHTGVSNNDAEPVAPVPRCQSSSVSSSLKPKR